MSSVQPSHSASLAKTLAVGSQDLAALAGFFCTDSVERNALATQYGHGVITTSALSILGALGLVKSTVKLSLGLDQCRKSGFSLDSLRSVYGYAENETAIAGNLVPCDEFNVKVNTTGVSIQKTRRYFDSTTRPILSFGNDIEGVFNTRVNPLRRGLEGNTLVNLGNPVHERSLLRHPVTAALSALLWSGLTAWLIVIGLPHWDWALYLATIGLHTSLASMLAIPLWFSFQVDRPGRAITSSKFSLLVSGKTDKSDSAGRMIFTQYSVNSGHGIYFHSSTDGLNSWSFRAFALVISTLCAVSYICQYAVLKQASSRNAAIWIGSQAFLALGRVCYWIVKRPNPQQGEFCIFNNGDFETLNILTLSRLLPQGLTHFPKPIWDYLQRTLVRDILETACRDQTDTSAFGQEELFFLDLDVYELYKHAGSNTRTFGNKMTKPWRLGLYIPTGTSTVTPKLFVENPDMSNVFSHESDGAPQPWLMMPGSRRTIDSTDGESPPVSESKATRDSAVWFVRSKGCVGFIPSADLERRSLPQEGSNSNNQLFDDFRYSMQSSLRSPRQQRGQVNDNDVRIWNCATKGVILRDGEGWSDSYYPPYAALLRTNLHRALRQIQRYIDQGHNRKLMNSRTGLVQYPPLGRVRKWFGECWARVPGLLGLHRPAKETSCGVHSSV